VQTFIRKTLYLRSSVGGEGAAIAELLDPPVAYLDPNQKVQFNII
jgi:hypothetical protein